MTKLIQATLIPFFLVAGCAHKNETVPNGQDPATAGIDSKTSTTRTSTEEADATRATTTRENQRTETAAASTTEEKAADNTGVNKRDRAQGEPTADQSKNNKSDLNITAEIRRSIVKDKSLSVSAHNVKIIVQNGVVTLKGPVKSTEEKASVEKKANEVAGATNVKNQIEIAP